MKFCLGCRTRIFSRDDTVELHIPQREVKRWHASHFTEADRQQAMKDLEKYGGALVTPQKGV